MKRLLLAGLAGGFIMFIWMWLYWAATGLGSSSIRNIPDEDALAASLKAHLDTRGVYVLPYMSSGMDQAEMDAYLKKYEQGPIAMIIYDPVGSDPMMPGQLITGLLLNILACMVGAWFLERSTAMTSTYMARVAFCGMFGILISLSAHLLNWNWMGYPLDYISKWVADSVIGWVLAGLGIAAIMKPSQDVKA